MFGWLFDRAWTKASKQNEPSVQLEAASVVLRQGKRYRATVTLSMTEQWFATNPMIAEKLVEAGFKDVKVIGDQPKRKAEGTWAKLDANAPMDSHFSNVTEIT